jgi:Pretoxin HINT domain
LIISVFLRLLTVHNEKVCCTPRHRFFTVSGWLAARHLSPGIKVRSLDGEMRPILAISNEPAEVPVFNMRVDSQHTYFVGETGYLVHNEKDTGEDDDTQDDDIPGSTEDKERSLKQTTQPVAPSDTRPTS